MVVLSESRTTSDINDAELEISGYSLLRCNSINRRTGGVCMYMRMDVKIMVIYNKIVNKCWYLAVKVLKGMSPGIYLGIYKSHEAKNKDVIMHLEKLIEDLGDQNAIFTCIGDFNKT